MRKLKPKYKVDGVIQNIFSDFYKDCPMYWQPYLEVLKEKLVAEIKMEWKRQVFHECVCLSGFETIEVLIGYEGDDYPGSGPWRVDD